MATYKSYQATKDDFFDNVDRYVKRLRNDDTVTHIFIVSAHGAKSEIKEGEMRYVDVQFMHNIGDTREAARICNNLCAGIAMNEDSADSEEENGTLQ